MHIHKNIPVHKLTYNMCTTHVQHTETVPVDIKSELFDRMSAFLKEEKVEGFVKAGTERVIQTDKKKK